MQNERHPCLNHAIIMAAYLTWVRHLVGRMVSACRRRRLGLRPSAEARKSTHPCVARGPTRLGDGFGEQASRLDEGVQGSPEGGVQVTDGDFVRKAVAIISPVKMA